MKKEISVVIPTYNREELLQKCVLSIIGQDIDPKIFEIIICDDGSSDNSEFLIKEIISKNPNYDIIYKRQKNSGPAKARNMGIKVSQGKIIALTDDDCQPDKNWLSEIKRSFDNDEKIVGVAGITYTQIEKITPFTHQIDNDKPWSFPTCNVAYSKLILDEIGGFDSSFPFTNEDADIAWRVEQKGEIIHNPKMRVLHPPRATNFIKELKTIRYLDSEFLLRRKMPEIYKTRKISPYREILYVHGIKIGLKKIVKNINWLLKNPWIYFKLLVLVIAQRLYLLALLPGFIIRDIKARRP